MIVEGIRWKRVEEGDAASLPDGRTMRVHIGGRAIRLVRDQGRLHALLDRCPHQGASFAGGWCEAGHLVCPVHRMAFHLESGRCRSGGTDSAEVFPVEERADGVYLGFAYTTFRIFGVELW
jgi:nitrite reductase/ring-hydroxylating ferredoxin subunit